MEKTVEISNLVQEKRKIDSVTLKDSLRLHSMDPKLQVLINSIYILNFYIILFEIEHFEKNYVRAN